MSVTLGPLEWIAMLAVAVSWVVLLIGVLRCRSTGQYGEGRRRREMDGCRDALRASHARELSTHQASVTAWREVVRLRVENELLRKRDTA
jgi:hypothetical protein